MAFVALMPGGKVHYQGDAPMVNTVRGVESDLKGAVQASGAPHTVHGSELCAVQPHALAEARHCEAWREARAQIG